METNFDQSVIEDWVYRVPQISVFLSVVIRQGLHVLHSVPDQTKDILNLVPACKGIRTGLVSPFPRGAWEWWWARPRVNDPQPPIRELIQVMASFSQLQLLSSLSSSGRCVLIFREAGVSVWGKTFRMSRASAAGIVESIFICSVFLQVSNLSLSVQGWQDCLIVCVVLFILGALHFPGIPDLI